MQKDLSKKVQSEYSLKVFPWDIISIKVNHLNKKTKYALP